MPTYKDEQTGKWYCSFYYTDYTGTKKKKKKTGFERQKDAKLWERDFLNSKAATPDITFKNLVAAYTKDSKKRLKATTGVNKDSIQNKHFTPYFGEMQIKDISPYTVRNWQNDMISKGFSDSYLRTLHANLSAIFNFATKFYNLPENPCKKAGLMGKAKRSKDKIVFWTLEEYKQFQASYDHEKNYPLYVMVTTLFWTGMRPGELLALTPEDIDFENNTISINKRYKRIPGKDDIDTPKTEAGTRTIDVPEKLTNLLGEYIWKTQTVPNYRIFEFNNSTIGRYMKKVFAEHPEIKPITVKDLRHSHASYLVNKNFSILAIKDRLGHEKIETTLGTYSHLYASTIADISDSISKDF